MIVDKDLVLKDLDGNAIKDGDSDLTLGAACTVALSRCGVTAEGRPAEYAAQKKRYDIARRIKGGESITAEDITEIRLCAAMTFASPLIVGPIGEQLDLLVIAPQKATDASEG
jgi:hypothetical protein